ncbi:VOC family protein [Actinomadura geliboluensis]
MSPTFRGGHNIAMKLPKAQFDRTVAFYRDVLGMEVTDESGQSAVDQCASVQLGPVKLWFDRVDNYARADLWLELFTDDVDAATRASGRVRCPRPGRVGAVPRRLGRPLDQQPGRHPAHRPPRRRGPESLLTGGPGDVIGTST